MLPTGARFRTLYNNAGLTAAGRYYYDQTGIEPPGKFDFEQDAVRKGRSQYIKLLDGTQKKVSTWDSVKKEWKLTALGRTFFFCQSCRPLRRNHARLHCTNAHQRFYI